MKVERTSELVIIGGGPAGLTAAIYAAQANIATVLLEKSVTGGLMNETHTVHNFPSVRAIHGLELMERIRDQVDGLGVTIEEICDIAQLRLAGSVKTVETEETIYRCRAVILATGRRPIPLEVPTVCEQVHYCAICDSGPYRGKRVLVVGGGNSAFDESRYLLKTGVAHLTLVEIMDRFGAARSTQEALLATGRVEARTKTRVVDLLVENKVLIAVVLENLVNGRQETVPVEGVFVFIGQRPNHELFRGQLPLNPNGYLIVGSDMSTALPGVFGAGDINDKPYRQITTAMADGTIAALSVERYLRDH